MALAGEVLALAGGCWGWGGGGGTQGGRAGVGQG